jgi:hypothetical protein
MMTLVATAPNLVVNSELERHGVEGFRLFGFTPFGVPVLVLGLLYMSFAANSRGARRRQVPIQSVSSRNAAKLMVAKTVMDERRQNLGELFGRPERHDPAVDLAAPGGRCTVRAIAPVQSGFRPIEKHGVTQQGHTSAKEVEAHVCLQVGRHKCGHLLRHDADRDSRFACRLRAAGAGSRAGGPAGSYPDG